MAKHRRTFTPEFKVQAVKLVTEQGRSVAEVARDLDLSESPLRSWKPALAVDGPRAFPGHGNLPALEDELRRLRAENQRLPMERDILPLNASIARPPFSLAPPPKRIPLRTRS